MICSNSLEVTTFPVRVQLRDKGTSLVVREDGKVFCGPHLTENKLVAQCSPDSPAFRPFMFFWAVVFRENSLSLANNQMVKDLISGDMEQDRDCPDMFIDKRNAYPMDSNPDTPFRCMVLKADHDGNITPYNPDSHYVNTCWALADNTRIKFHVVIEDHYGHDLPVGWSVGITTQAGSPPKFNRSYLARRDEDVQEMGRALLKECPEPAPAPEPEKPDDDCPF